MENTIENKARFFAQYWGQTFVYTSDGRPIRNLPKRFVLNYENSDKLQLILFSNQRAVELIPLSQISDEEAIEVAKIIDSAPFITKKKWQIERIDNEPASYLKISSDKSYHYYEIDYDGYLWYKHEEDDEIPTMALPDYLGAFDYLRSKGYALPYMGLSVETLEEWGWIKLKTN